MDTYQRLPLTIVDTNKFQYMTEVANNLNVPERTHTRPWYCIPSIGLSLLQDAFSMHPAIAPMVTSPFLKLPAIFSSDVLLSETTYPSGYSLETRAYRSTGTSMHEQQSQKYKRMCEIMSGTRLQTKGWQYINPHLILIHNIQFVSLSTLRGKNVKVLLKG